MHEIREMKERTVSESTESSSGFRDRPTDLAHFADSVLLACRPVLVLVVTQVEEAVVVAAPSDGLDRGLPHRS